MTSVELVRSNAKHAWSRDVNQLVDVSRGNLGGYVLLRGYDGTRKDAAKGGAVLSSGQYPLDVQSPGGKHAAFVHSSTAAAAAPTSANAVVLITDDGLGIGHGAGLRLYETGGVDYAQFTSVDGGVTVGGSGAQAGAVGVQKLRVYEPVGGDYAELTSADGLLLLGGLGAFGGALSILGDLAITGVSKRITGDFSNAAAGSRLSVQSSTVNGATQLNLLPNGAGTISGYVVYAGSNPAAAAYADFLITSTELRIFSGHTAAAYLPISVYTGGAARIQISTAGVVTIPTALMTAAVDPPTTNTQVTAQSQAKAWAFVTGGGGATLGDNYNVASVSRTAAGTFQIVWDRDFTGATYALVVTVQENGAILLWRVNSQSAGSADVLFYTAAAALTDPDGFSVVAFGTLV
jgi:hypothetical protein